MEKIKYPKLILLTVSIFLAYALFQADFFEKLALTLNSHGYMSMFLGGALFSFGFTAAFAVAMFIELADTVHPFTGALIAGFGAVISDFLIFRFVRFSFQDEFEKLKLSWIIQKIKGIFDHHFSQKIKEYVLWTCAGFLIASPLPDEFGVTLLSGMTNIKQRTFVIIAFGLNTLGIFVILFFSKIGGEL